LQVFWFVVVVVVVEVVVVVVRCRWRWWQHLTSLETLFLRIFCKLRDNCYACATRLQAIISSARLCVIRRVCIIALRLLKMLL
jgi:hypothetical protein